MRILSLILSVILVSGSLSAPGTGCFSASQDGKCLRCMGETSLTGECTIFDPSSSMKCMESAYDPASTGVKSLCKICWGAFKPSTSEENGCVAITTPIPHCAAYFGEELCRTCLPGYANLGGFCAVIPKPNIISNCAIPMMDTLGNVRCMFCNTGYTPGPQFMTCTAGNTPCMRGTDPTLAECEECNFFGGYFTTATSPTNAKLSVCSKDTNFNFATKFGWTLPTLIEYGPLESCFAVNAAGQCWRCDGVLDENGICTRFEISTSTNRCADSTFHPEAIGVTNGVYSVCNFCHGGLKPDQSQNSVCIANSSPRSNCVNHLPDGKCQICMPGFYPNTDGDCIEIAVDKLINHCLYYLPNSNGEVVCYFCSRGYRQESPLGTKCIEGKMPCLLGTDPNQYDCNMCNPINGFYAVGVSRMDPTRSLCVEGKDDVQTRRGLTPTTLPETSTPQGTTTPITSSNKGIFTSKKVIIGLILILHSCI